MREDNVNDPNQGPLTMGDKHLTQSQVELVPNSNWYKYKLHCGHEAYSRVRITIPKTFNQHFIRCRKCQEKGASPLNWSAVEQMEAVTDEHVSNVLDGSLFILPKRILRTDGSDVKGRNIPSGNPFPYSTKDAEY